MLRATRRASLAAFTGTAVVAMLSAGAETVLAQNRPSHGIIPLRPSIVRQLSGQISKFDAVDDDGATYACTSSGNYQTLKNMSLTFTQGGGSPDDVTIEFQGADWISFAPFPYLDVRLKIDGAVPPGPGTVKNVYVYGSHDADGIANQDESHGFNFLFTASPGPHDVVVQWRTFNPGVEVCVGPRSLIVYHN